MLPSPRRHPILTPGLRDARLFAILYESVLRSFSNRLEGKCAFADHARRFGIGVSRAAVLAELGIGGAAPVRAGSIYSGTVLYALTPPNGIGVIWPPPDGPLPTGGGETVESGSAADSDPTQSAAMDDNRRDRQLDADDPRRVLGGRGLRHERHPAGRGCRRQRNQYPTIRFYVVRHCRIGG